MTIADPLSLNLEAETIRTLSGADVVFMGDAVKTHYRSFERPASALAKEHAVRIAREMRSDWRSEYQRIVRWAKVARTADEVPAPYKEAAMAVKVELLAYPERYRRARAEAADLIASRHAVPGGRVVVVGV